MQILSTEEMMDAVTSRLVGGAYCGIPPEYVKQRKDICFVHWVVNGKPPKIFFIWKDRDGAIKCHDVFQERELGQVVKIEAVTADIGGVKCVVVNVLMEGDCTRMAISVSKSLNLDD